jgi:aminopeptidase N
MGCTDNKEIVVKKIENMPDSNQWVIFNSQLAGLYKVKYDDRNYKLIVETLNSDNYTNIDKINRAILINDVSIRISFMKISKKNLNFLTGNVFSLE